MSARVLFKLLNELGKAIQCEACQVFAERIINLIKQSTNVQFYLAHDIKLIRNAFLA